MGKEEATRLTGEQYYPKISPVYSKEGGSVYGSQDGEVLRLLDSLGSAGRILEIGAGDARYTFYMLEQGLNVVATDYSEEALAILQSRSGHLPEAQQARLSLKKLNAFGEYPFANNSFDAVVATGFLYVFPEELIVKFLQESHRVLDRTGKLIFDFATDIRRVDSANTELRSQSEVRYDLTSGFEIIARTLIGRFSVSEATGSTISEEYPKSGYTMNNKKINVLAEKII